MNYHIYIKYSEDLKFIEKQKKTIKDYCNSNKIDLQNNQFENTTLLRIYKNSENGDTLIIYKLDVLGTTTYSILNVMTKFFKKGVNINILNKNNNYLVPSLNTFSIGLLENILQIERINLEKRAKVAQLTCKKKGKMVGRKKSLKTKSIYDEHKNTIIELSKNEVPKTKIIKKIGIGSSQGLGKYIKKLLKIEKEKDDLKEKKKLKEKEKDIGKRFSLKGRV